MDDRRTFLQSVGMLPAAAMVSVSSSAQPSGAQEPNDVMAYAKDPIPPQQALPDPDRIGSATRSRLIDVNNPSNWRDSKRKLAAALRAVAPGDPVVTWLETFDDSFDVMSGRAVLAGGTALYRPDIKSQVRYEPQLFEAWLKSASVLLDRCLEYRREMGGYEISGVKAGFDYLAFLNTNPLQRYLLKLSNQADVAEIQRQAQLNASHKYAEAIALEKVARGHALESDGASKLAALTGAKENLRLVLQQRQFDVNAEAQLAQFTRFLTPGSASNYAERYLRLQLLLAEDLSDAYCKLFSAAQGVVSVLGIKSVAIAGKPAVDVLIPAFEGKGDVGKAAIAAWVAAVVSDQGPQRSPDVLDAMVLWTRAVLREMERSAQYESEVTISVPLSQPSGSRTEPIVTSAQVTAAFGGAAASGGANDKSKSASISFTLGADALPFSASLARLRVVGVGLSVVHDVSDAVAVEYSPGFPVVTNIANSAAVQATQVKAAENFAMPKLARLNATLTPPPQVAGGGVHYNRPPLLLPNVRIQGGYSGDSEAPLSNDPGCRNINPLGVWSIALDKNALLWFASASAGQPLSNFVTGLILHLRVRVVAS